MFEIQLERESVDQNTLYLEVKLTRGKNFIPRKFPLVSNINKDKVREFTNDFDQTISYFYDCYSL